MLPLPLFEVAASLVPSADDEIELQKNSGAPVSTQVAPESIEV